MKLTNEECVCKVVSCFKQLERENYIKTASEIPTGVKKPKIALQRGDETDNLYILYIIYYIMFSTAFQAFWYFWQISNILQLHLLYLWCRAFWRQRTNCYKNWWCVANITCDN